MGIQYAHEYQQPGETLRYSMEFEPGVSLAVGDSLTGTPTVKVYKKSDNSDVTSSMISGTPGRLGNVVYWFLKGGTSGEFYRVSVRCDTVFGEKSVEEDLIVPMREL